MTDCDCGGSLFSHDPGCATEIDRLRSYGYHAAADAIEGADAIRYGHRGDEAIVDPAKPGRYRKLPVVIEAVQWTGYNEAVVANFVGLPGYGDPPRFVVEGDSARLWVAANGDYLKIRVGEWVLKDASGCYPCLPKRFAETYEVVP